MKANQACHNAAMMCRVLDAFTKGLHKWLKRSQLKRALEDVAFGDRAWWFQPYSQRTFGMPCVQAELADEGVRAGGIRVAP